MSPSIPIVSSLLVGSFKLRYSIVIETTWNTSRYIHNNEIIDAYQQHVALKKIYILFIELTMTIVEYKANVSNENVSYVTMA